MLSVCLISTYGSTDPLNHMDQLICMAYTDQLIRINLTDQLIHMVYTDF